ncbi:hypothetical protein L798_07436 [Zootermopsis nevadensis]|uniref:Uncharacterized protein n=1 Tax=Zootermopsis nevadensis TaxID=136037 RepID=A0A067RED2_ZOONE|nr:hypothetical protein L798_07436 [Zootermopsis nevadensis]
MTTSCSCVKAKCMSSIIELENALERLNKFREVLAGFPTFTNSYACTPQALDNLHRRANQFHEKRPATPRESKTQEITNTNHATLLQGMHLLFMGERSNIYP